MKFNLYAGLSGGFNTVQFHCTEEFDDYEEAESAARDLAIEEYQSYEGAGLRTWEDCRDEMIEELGENAEIDEEDIDLHYIEEVESWIVYYVKPCDADTQEEDADE